MKADIEAIATHGYYFTCPPSVVEIYEELEFEFMADIEFEIEDDIKFKIDNEDIEFKIENDIEFEVCE